MKWQNVITIYYSSRKGHSQTLSVTLLGLVSHALSALMQPGASRSESNVCSFSPAMMNFTRGCGLSVLLCDRTCAQLLLFLSEWTDYVIGDSGSMRPVRDECVAPPRRPETDSKQGIILVVNVKWQMVYTEMTRPEGSKNTQHH